ncbi:uncharacterized protein LOC110449870 isoform X2 [Mizuhopecten yessoensis]|uniref:uncharacterized protein LOC110449870 isoform X2 n=1 Tax=Mizuhopecten yessoensis TaxID=6573 RepID=UPI000B45E4CC|nr:uncharacterized protein LOC110449870 isoform X2 [Mizuhopecten yessoensis]
MRTTRLTSGIFLTVITINDSPDEDIVNVIPKARTTFTGRSYAGEELQKMLGNDGNLNTHTSGSVQDARETENPRHPGLPVAPILKYYEIIGPPWISAERHNLHDDQIPDKEICESGIVTSTEVEQIQQNEATPQLSRISHHTSEKTLASLPELDQTPEGNDLSRAPITSTPIMDKSDTLPMFVGIRLLGMSME